MKRKVSKIGPSTLMVSLPSKWVKENGVKAGDELEILEEGGKITFAGQIKIPKREINITIPHVEDYLARFICSPYIKGYDIINVRFEDREVYDKILRTSRLLMGFEIVENTKNSCKLVNISTKLEQNFDILLGRLFTGGMSFTRELFERLKEKNTNIKSLLEYEDNANRISLFCRRVMQTSNAGEFVYSKLTLYSIVTHLEEITDSFRHIVETLGEKKIKLNRETIDLFNKCIRVQEINFTIFNKLMKGEKAMPHIELFKEHKKIRKEVFHNPEYFAGDKINSYICNWLMHIVELSHHINEELFY